MTDYDIDLYYDIDGENNDYVVPAQVYEKLELLSVANWRMGSIGGNRMTMGSFDNWFPIIKAFHFNSVINIKKYEIHLLNFMGFKVRDSCGSNHDFKIFDSFGSCKRSKQNYMLLQTKLIDAGLGKSAIFDFINLPKLDRLYEASNK